MWIFGYGSIVWRPAFPFADRVIARADGVARRFWQQSTDHRGVPGAPGRVCTLVDAPTEHCWGAAFRLNDDEDERREILASLDHREKNGYAQRTLTLAVRPGADAQRVGENITALTYIGTPDNDAFWGPASAEVIAQTAAVAEGPSGTNREYVLKLAAALREADVACAHTFSIEAALLEILNKA